MRACPVCEEFTRASHYMSYFEPPDGVNLPQIYNWFECRKCGMIYADNDEMSQAQFDEYYARDYGYGVESPANGVRLRADAVAVQRRFSDLKTPILDFGASADSTFTKTLRASGYTQVDTLDVLGELKPNGFYQVIFASHVLEHIYDLPKVMCNLTDALTHDGVLIIDGPDALGILRAGNKALLDFNTKHINHFCLNDYVRLAERYFLRAEEVRHYDLEGESAWQVWCSYANVLDLSMEKINARTWKVIAQCKPYTDQAVNVWGLSDAAWYYLPIVGLRHILNYIDNDPMYRTRTYRGQRVLEQPDNDFPILVFAQGQRERLIANIRARGVTNEIIVIGAS